MDKLSRIVRDNWTLVYAGAKRLGVNEPMDFWAPERAQIGPVRLHKAYGVKAVQGWHYYRDEEVLREEHLITAVEAVNNLFAEAGKEVPCSFTIKMVKE